METETGTWLYSIVLRGDYDDLTLTIPCGECGKPCGHHDNPDAPLHWAVVKYINTEPKFVCIDCTTKGGALFIWEVAKAVDTVDHLFYGVGNSEDLRRIADLVDHCIGKVTEGWRQIEANDDLWPYQPEQG